MNLRDSKFFLALLLSAIVISGADSAFAANIGNQPMTTVEDVIAATGTNPVLKKDSLLYVVHDSDNGNTEFKYARFGDDYKLETTDKTFFTTNLGVYYKYSGLHPAVSKNYTTSTLPPAIVMAGHVAEDQYTYPVNLYNVSKDSSGVKMSAKGSAQSENVPHSNTYKDVSDCKGGIFASGSNREIFVTAEWVEFNGGGEVYLDFFSVAQGGGDIKAEKHFLAAIGALALDQPVLAKIAVGDFNGDGYANEIALLTNCYDVWKYYLSVFHVNWKGSAIEVTTMVQSKELYSNKVYNNNNKRDLYYFKAAGDVVMADFNGDGRTEIATVYKGHNEDVPYSKTTFNDAMGSVHVKLFQWNSSKSGNDKLVESKAEAKKSFIEFAEDMDYNSIGDLKAVAADVDGDGKSELAMLGMHWKTHRESAGTFWTVTWGTWTARLHLWRHSPTANAVVTNIAATLNIAYDKEIQNFGVFYQLDSEVLPVDLNAKSTRSAITSHTFTDTAFEMTSGVFTGVVSSNNRACEDIVVSRAGYERAGNPEYYTANWIKVISPVLDNDGKLKSDFKVTDITAFDSKSKTIGLAAGDFVGDGILLKNPYHFYFEGRNVFTSIIQALPYHVDYIPLTWEKDGKPKLANLTYVPGGEVTYVRTTETKDKNTVKTTSTSTYEMKTKLGASVSWSPTEFIPWVPANPNDKFSPKHSFLLDANLNYNGKDTAQKLEASTETVKTTETIKSTAVDSIMAYSVRHHFWRYPIDPVPAWYKARSKDITDDGKLAYTVTMTEAPKSHKGRIGYNARHEEGNLFSYPTKMDNIPDFTNAKSKILTEAVEYLLEPGEYKKEVEITISKEKEKNVTAEYTWQAGFDFQYMFGNYGIGKSGIRVDTDHQWSWGGLRNNVLNSTFTKGDKLSIAFADPSKASKMIGLTNNVAFATTYQAYINPNGLMKMGFAVNLQGGGSPVPMLWRESVYNVSADPSFVLPKKFAIKDSTIAVNPDKLDATSMRGVELYAIYKGKQIILTAPYFVPDQTYVISVPIYNASFVDVPSFTVRLSYAPYKSRNDTSKFTKIGDFTVTGLKGWTHNSEVNKTYANFSFQVPANLTFGDYVFWAEIDPEQKIKEVHEEWSEKIPGGNNTGNCAL